MKRCLASLALLLAGCATPQAPDISPSILKFEAQAPLSIRGNWALLEGEHDGRRTRGRHLTRHGEMLDRVWLVEGVRTGQRLVEASEDTRDGPPYSGRDLQDLVQGSLWALGYGGVAWDSPPDAGGGVWGVRARFITVNDDGLEYSGAMRARQRGDRLDLAIWIAESGVYAPRIEADADAILDQLG